MSAITRESSPRLFNRERLTKIAPLLAGATSTQVQSVPRQEKEDNLDNNHALKFGIASPSVSFLAIKREPFARNMRIYDDLQQRRRLIIGVGPLGALTR